MPVKKKDLVEVGERRSFKWEGADSLRRKSDALFHINVASNGDLLKGEKEPTEAVSRARGIDRQEVSRCDVN